MMSFNNFIPDNPSPLSSDYSKRIQREDYEVPQQPQLSIPQVPHSPATPPKKIIDDKLDYDESDDNNNVADDHINSSNYFLLESLELKEFPLFKQAPNSFYNKIISNLKLVTYHPQSYIVKMGDPSKSMYWILKGTVSIASSDGDSVYNELSSGQFFGEIGILFNRPRTANVIAKTKVLVGVLTSKDFNHVLRSFPLMERRIRDEAQERLAMLEKISKHSNILPPILPLNGKKIDDDNNDNLDSSISIQRFLKNLPIFQNLPSNIIHKIALGAEPIKFKSFQYILQFGDIGSDIYFIINGQVEVLNEEEKILAKLNNGNYFGEMSFLNFLKNNSNFKRSASVRSITNVELIVIKSNLLKKLCKEYPFLIDHMKRTSETRNQINNSPEVDEEFNSFKNYEFKFDFKPLHSRSVSPVTTVDEEIFEKPYSPGPILHSVNPPNLAGPSLVGSSSLNSILNPIPTIKRRPSQFSLPNDQLDYIPHNKRLKLQSIGRRKSSVLANTGPLTDQLLIMIFEYLDVVTLMKLRSVSKRWRQLLYISPNLCKNLDLRPWNNIIGDEILISITKFVGNRPEFIDISNCFHITDEGFSYMINEIGISGNLKSVKLKSNWEISAMAIMDLSVRSVGKSLQEIDLSNCRKVRDNVIERLIGWDNDEEIGCKQLTRLNLGYCKHLTDNVMYHISDHCNQRLTHLDLTRCTTITDKGFEYWTYKFFPNLTSLSLKDCTFLTDKSIISIANSVPNLTSLNLNFCCSLTDISIEVLCIGCQNLKFLDLSFCGSAVSDSSLLTISLNLKNLESLILTGCIRVTRAGIDSLLSSDSPLSYLNVSQCKNSDIYPGSIPAQKLNINPKTKSAFVKAGAFDKIIEIVI
ncbi:hypothetical protein CLIB1444_12S01838 [[Candida] jaroonii]|uniref:Uncharacterized protein n=1 Tax=[Candida] jaroonii TaxID=467808 RepID=A0ACA9YD64_9ASCO|nr:hypothetical protein CLIB1444_12S01838 [[Candida] jaroonii]